MNKHEYYKAGGPRNTFYKHVHEELQKWAVENNITEECIVHHRDDNDEVKMYNEKHYERWGFEEDGTFEYGKYVIFMTRSMHSRYHNAREKHPMYGKHHTDAVRKRLVEANYGKTLSSEHKQKISESHKGQTLSDNVKQKISAAGKARMKIVSDLWRLYKQLHPDPVMTYTQFRSSLKATK